MTRAIIIDGKAAAEELRQDIAQHVGEARDYHHIVPGLAVVLVGADPASQVYVRNKNKFAVEVGMRSFEHFLPEDTSESELLTLIEGLNDDPAVHGILVQLPLPRGIDTQLVIETIDPVKDVDGFHPYNVGRLFTGGQGVTPCTPLGCLELLKRSVGDLTGKRAIVLGRSNIVGKPMAQLLVRENCTVTIAHSKTLDLPHECRRADIVVAAIGQPEMVRGDWIKPGAAVIDVGINRVPLPGGKSRLVGDVKFDEAVEVAGFITPVPGGVGPMTISMLLRNTLLLCCRQSKIDEGFCERP
ncbi:MAG: bifunctional methylenetetrahydrofolate dehydrogenase/methenyltetrahydrofolate cyclohydrolase FolD [Alphaproteobacteria bacterium]|nr:bifunctional methylenetetrahydrofolate dehydrogenase/methenyltetrahydrofolate cyclohydrolase FolD [Alphaproteobacteria bacterium]MBF0128828.1 bifunctional methylenetetrahydrofolate dehydrogenase/methenyltetrahydrofolate cyclohydrolase FolD [Alphaproteobacteria bacterium]